MPNYRRAFVPGGSWFFTVTLLDRRSDLLTERIDVLREALAATRRRYPFAIDSIVILPDHIHAIWTLPGDEADFSLRWCLIKARFARAIPDVEHRSAVRDARGERGIWQRRYWEHTIRDESDFARHVDYIHINPVKHGLVTRVRDWAHSSFHRMVKLGIYPEDWAGDVSGSDEEFGERP